MRHDLSGGLGRALSECRQELNLELEQVAKLSGIRAAKLQALEDGDYEQIPHTVYSLGFVRRYAKAVGLDPAAAHQYLLERGPLPQAQTRLSKRRIKQPIVTSRLFFGLVMGILVLSALSYLLWQVIVLTGNPRLIINTPKDNQTVYEQRLEVRGTTAAGAEVTIDGVSVLVGDDGSFSTTIHLQSGVNTIAITARNRLGRETSVNLNTLVKLPR